MLVYNNQQRSGYEEIASYSPRYYRNIKEMDAVFRLAGWLLDLMAQNMEDMVAFQFLKYMDDEAYVVPVSNSYSIDAVNSKITGYSSKPSAANSLWYNVGIAK